MWPSEKWPSSNKIKAVRIWKPCLRRYISLQWLPRKYISYQPLECEGALRVSRYGSPSAKNYDGVHLRGKLAVQHYTGSMINVLSDAMPNTNPTFSQSNSNSGHSNIRPQRVQPQPVHPAWVPGPAKHEKGAQNVIFASENTGLVNYNNTWNRFKVHVKLTFNFKELSTSTKRPEPQSDWFRSPENGNTVKQQFFMNK